MTSVLMSGDKGTFVPGIQPSIWDDQNSFDSSWYAHRDQSQNSLALQGVSGAYTNAMGPAHHHDGRPLGGLVSAPGASISGLNHGPGAIGTHGLPRNLGHTAATGPGMMPIAGGQLASRHHSAPVNSQIHGKMPRVAPSLGQKRGGNAASSGAASSSRGVMQSNIFDMRSASIHSQQSSSSQGLVSGSGLPASDMSVSSTNSSISDEELIPTAIVIKNIPFAIKKEQLMDVMTELGIPLPYAFNYHFDSGVFRGLAFANFSTSDETAMAISLLNDREIGGRKLRVEYKKMLPLQERERIEREKRERRGQLEEQHLYLNQPQAQSQTQGNKSRAASVSSINRHIKRTSSPSSISNLSSTTENLRLSSGPSADLNDQSILDIYTSLVMISCDKSCSGIKVQLAPHSEQLSTVISLCERLGLWYEWEDDLFVIKRQHAQDLTTLPSALFEGAKVIQ